MSVARVLGITVAFGTYGTAVGLGFVALRDGRFDPTRAAALYAGVLAGFFFLYMVIVAGAWNRRARWLRNEAAKRAEDDEEDAA